MYLFKIIEKMLEYKESYSMTPFHKTNTIQSSTASTTLENLKSNILNSSIISETNNGDIVANVFFDKEKKFPISDILLSEDHNNIIEVSEQTIIDIPSTNSLDEILFIFKETTKSSKL